MGVNGGLFLSHRTYMAPKTGNSCTELVIARPLMVTALLIYEHGLLNTVTGEYVDVN